MTRQEAAPLWARKAAGDPAAREALILGHQRLVAKTRERAIPRVPSAIAVEDLLSEGNVALIRAVDRYEPARGVQFTSFAIALIRGVMLEWLRKEDWVTRGARAKQKQLAAAEEALWLSGEPPTAAALAAELALTEEKFHRFRQEAGVRQVVSLDARHQWGEEDTADLTRADQLVDPAPGPEALVMERWRAGLLNEARGHLPASRREVVRHYYDEAQTLKVIAGKFGKSESRMHQLHAEALARLKEMVPAEVAA